MSKVSNYNNHNGNIIMTISISSSSNLSQYTKHTMRWLQRKAVTHNQECHGDSNRYTPYRRKPDQHDTYALTPVHVRLAYASFEQPRMWQPFTSRRQIWMNPTGPAKRAPDTIYIKQGDRFVGPYPVSLLSQPLNQWGQSQTSIGNQLFGLPGP